MQSPSENRKTWMLLLLFALMLLALSFWIETTKPEMLNSPKIAQLLRLFSGVLAVTGITFYLTSKSSIPWLQRNSFGVTIAIASTLLLIGYRFLIQAGIGLYPAANQQVSSGFLFYPEDNFSYAAWATQARKGAWLFHDPYTLKEHRQAYFNPFFLLIGWTAEVFPISPLAVMTITGILSSAFVIASVHAICRKIHFPEGAGRWATLFAAFASGFSVPLYYLSRWLGGSIPVGADLRYMDSILFSTFYTLPYQSFAYAIQAGIVLLLLRCERKDSKRVDLVMLAVVQMFSLFTRPYEWVLMIGGYGISLLLSRVRSRKQILILSILIGASVPGVVYNWWISQQPVWQSFAQITMSQEKFRLYWLLGYGLMTPLAIAGTIAIWRNRNGSNARWISASACMALFLLIVLNIKQVKIASCGPLFLCIAGGVGMYKWTAHIQEIKFPAMKLLARIAILPALILLFGTSLFLMLAYFHVDTFDSELIHASRAIRSGTSVLCDAEDGNILPAIAAIRVYAGHWALTPGFSTLAKPFLVASGIEQGNSGDRDSFTRLFSMHKFDYVLVHKNRPAFVWIRSSPEFGLIQCYRKRCLFATVR